MLIVLFYYYHPSDLEDGVVVSVQKETGDKVAEEVDFAILAIGVRPESQLAQAAGVSYCSKYNIMRA